MAIKPIITELDDLSPMPFGNKYRGVPMQDVPVSYLHWMWHNVSFTGNNHEIKLVQDYIRKNLVALKEENEDLIWS